MCWAGMHCRVPSTTESSCGEPPPLLVLMLLLLAVLAVLVVAVRWLLAVRRRSRMTARPRVAAERSWVQVRSTIDTAAVFMGGSSDLSDYRVLAVDQWGNVGGGSSASVGV